MPKMVYYGQKWPQNGKKWLFWPLCVDSSSAILITILISSYLVITDLILANFALFCKLKNMNPDATGKTNRF